VVGLALAGPAMGCGGSGGAKFAIDKTGDMPANEEWTGVYYSPVYGNLILQEQGGNITGRWKRKDGSKWGELSGTADGNALHFTWTEHTYGGIGPAAHTHGNGVFRYTMNENNLGVLTGLYSFENSGSDPGHWDCVKQLNMKADINSINGDSADTQPVSRDHWQ
jgi:hypothetical protein